ncbi:pilin [Comamonas odontotermitis]|uniref:pilin n=1 Tax=Comamonas odontotermitis TaxID=379895 RepID=UPI003750B243
MQILEKGFTLVEMMIVLAIIGVLGGLALVAYDDYISKGQIDEAITLLAGLRNPLVDYSSQNNSWPTSIVGSGVNAASTEISASITGKYATITSSVSGVYPSGVITATLGSNTRMNGQTIIFSTTDGGANWLCNGGTVVSRKRPQACR